MDNMLNSKVYYLIHASIICSGILIIILVSIWTGNYLGGFASSDKPLLHFNFHPLLAILGLIVLYGEGLLLFRNLRYQTKPVLKFVHGVVMLIIFVLCVVSLKCVFDSHNKRSPPIPNLYSLHSWIGIGTVILFSVQLACGFLSFVYPGMHSIYQRAYMPYHRFMGLTIFVLSVLSCHSGIMEKVKASLKEEYLKLPPAAFVANFLGVAVTVYAILVVFLASKPEFRRIPLPEENILQLEMHSKV